METEFKGTKGKWSIGDLKISVWAENRKGCVADCSGIHHKEFYLGFEKEEMLANAKLISKAPELLKMLIDILEQENLSQSAHDEVCKLIKETLT